MEKPIDKMTIWYIKGDNLGTNDKKIVVQVTEYRISLSNKKIQIPYLDGWRGLAICALLIGHFFPVPGINFGQLGVNLFFVLSGFLMSKILFIDNVPIRTFYQRRFSRIFPALYFFIISTVFIYFTNGHWIDFSETAAAASLLINYFPGSPGNAVMPFGHIWSLCVEEHSYIVLSLTALSARAAYVSAKVSVVSLTFIFAFIGILYWATYMGAHLSFDRLIHSEVAAFGIFASASLVLFLHRKNLSQVPSFIAPLLIFLGCVAHWWSVPVPFQLVFGVGAFAVAVNLLETAPSWLLAILSTSALRQLGFWSFSIYIWQQPFYLAVGRLEMPGWLGILLGLTCGVTSFYLIEEPARHYINRLWKPITDSSTPFKLN
jgi:peptidoglycan/LPS O-acetylase OafA/YrhL